MTTTDLEPVTQPALTLWRSDDQNEIVQQATQVADTLAKVIHEQRLAVKISGRDHVKVEGWTLLGTMLGVQPYVVWSRPIAGEDFGQVGWEARVEARTLDGRTISAAEAQCTRHERTWKQRDDYALRSMAQTRAVSKALRLPLGFVMSLAGFDPTPADEMPAPLPRSDMGPRQRVVLGPEVPGYDTGPPPEAEEPGPDFGPIDDPQAEEESAFKPPAQRPDQRIPLTERQRKTITEDLIPKLRKRNPDLYSDASIELALHTRFSCSSVTELTQHQASELIDTLIAKEKEPQQ